MVNLMTNSNSGSKRRRRDPRRAPRIEGSVDMRRLLQQRDRLYEESRRDPDSEAAELARTFLFAGLLADQRSSGTCWAKVARLEQIVRDQRTRLDEIARAAQEAQEHKLDAREICHRIAVAVGLAPASQADYDEVFHTGAAAPHQEEETCQTQNTFQIPTPVPKA